MAADPLSLIARRIRAVVWAVLSLTGVVFAGSTVALFGKTLGATLGLGSLVVAAVFGIMAVVAAIDNVP